MGVAVPALVKFFSEQRLSLDPLLSVKRMANNSPSITIPSHVDLTALNDVPLVREGRVRIYGCEINFFVKIKPYKYFVAAFALRDFGTLVQYASLGDFRIFSWRTLIHEVHHCRAGIQFLARIRMQKLTINVLARAILNVLHISLRESER